MASKREMRQEAKKRKASAFLHLVKPDCETVEQLVQRVQENPTPENPRPQTPTGNWEEVCSEKRRILAAKRKEQMGRPTLSLLLDNVLRYNQPLLQHEGVKATLEAPPLFLFDLRQLLWFALLSKKADFRPRWCSLLQVENVTCVALLVWDGVGMQDIREYKEACSYLWDKFAHHIEIVSPAQYGGNVLEELTNIPISRAQIKKWKALQAATAEKETESAKADAVKIPLLGVSLPPIPCSPLDLLLTPTQLAVHKFPLPVSMTSGLYRNYVYSKEEYTAVTDTSPLFAVDCEMCFTSAKKNELARVSIVNEQGKVVYDTYVKPRNPILDYLTRFSGITEKILETVTTRLEDVQEFIQKNLPSDAILCGQALNFDLCALQMFHPYVIDTSLIYNISGDPQKKTGLKGLVHDFLGKRIQGSAKGHCSVEDAKAALELVKLKLEKGLQFGDATIHSIKLPAFEFEERTRDGSIVEESSCNVHKVADGHLDNPAAGVKSTSPDRDVSTGDFSADVDPRKALFLNRESSSSVNAFRLLHSCGKSACVVDRQDVADQVPTDCGVARHPVDCDEAAATQAQTHIQQHDFVWVGSPDIRQAFLPGASQMERMTALGNFERRLQELLQQVPKNALTVLLATGRRDDTESVNSAAAFLTIK